MPKIRRDRMDDIDQPFKGGEKASKRSLWDHRITVID